MMGRSAYFPPSPGIRLVLFAGNICGFCGFCRTFSCWRNPTWRSLFLHLLSC
ncbi:hypothetical protein CORC01_10574 [Colletotrichum orchidophilum]|uniref:Uncharacterized protein n=1 Tax=Colletotrichum orchidophilum TaxID=1209926 RepID=A0A1G4AYA2_9PEZI|nr:uncharacterized protein CORC01_10574 [Colletotrichum orchidophilum]OHE94117.1 hypothetical protein CORC01_10574 [Colletotrichum orchidophilum]